MTHKQVLFIFDLNGCLCMFGKKKDIKPRPFLQFFFDRLLHLEEQGACRFAFWTSKTEVNGKLMIQAIETASKVSDLRNRALFSWFNPQCTSASTTEEPYGWIKDLKKVWAAYPQFNEQTTYLIDDSPSKAGDYKATNLVVCPTYEGQHTNATDNKLLDLLSTLQLILEEHK